MSPSSLHLKCLREGDHSLAGAHVKLPRVPFTWNRFSLKVRILHLGYPHLLTPSGTFPEPGFKEAAPYTPHALLITPASFCLCLSEPQDAVMSDPLRASVSPVPVPGIDRHPIRGLK